MRGSPAFLKSSHIYVLNIITCRSIGRVAKINYMSCTSIGVSRRKCLGRAKGEHSHSAKYSSPGSVKDLIWCMHSPHS